MNANGQELKTNVPSANFASMIGRVSRDPRLGGASDRPVANVDIAVSSGYMADRREPQPGESDKEWKETVQFFQAAVWGEFPSARAMKLSKGDMVQVVFDPSQIKTRIWGDNQDKVDLSFNAKNLFFLAGRNAGSDNNGEYAQEPAMEDVAI